MLIIILACLFILILFSSSALCGKLIQIAHKKGWYDTHDNRKIHTGNIPRIGGIAISVGLLLGSLLFFTLGISLDLLTSSALVFPGIVLSAGFIIHTVGLIDDFHTIRPRYKLYAQILIALVLVVSGHSVSAIQLPFFFDPIQLGWVAPVFTIVWVLGITNAVNLIDGMDGLAGGIGTIAALIFGVFALLTQQYVLLAVALFLGAGITGFLFHNFHPARIFMGDSGSLLIGFTLAALPLAAPDTQIGSTGLILMASLLIIPILDTLAAIVRRQAKGSHFFIPDKEHVHHLILERGVGPRRSAILFYLWSLAAGGTALWFSRQPSLYSGVLLYSVWAASILGVSLLNTSAIRRYKRAQAQKNQAKSWSTSSIAASVHK